MIVGLARRERVHAAAVVDQLLQVDLGRDDSVRHELGLRQHAAVLADDVVAREHQVRRGFVRTRAGIEVGGVIAGGLHGDHVAAELVLRDLVRARGGVHDDRGARQSVRGAGTLRDPEVLADLAGNDAALDISRLQQDVGAHQDLIVLAVRAGGRDETRLAPARREVPHLVKFVIAGDIGLRDQAEDVAAENCRHDIV